MSHVYKILADIWQENEVVMSPLTLAFVVCLWPVCESAFDLGFLENMGIYLLRYSAMLLLFLAQPPRMFFHEP